MKRLGVVILLCITSAVAAPADGKTKRILVVGDSWAMSITPENHDSFPSHDVFGKVLAASGFSNIATQGKVTAWGGRKASDWAKPANLKLIADELRSYPTIDVVHLIIGGNDFLKAVQDPGFITKSRSERDASWNRIKTDVQTIVDTCLAVRTNIQVVIADYDYLDYRAAERFWKFDFHGATVRQLNSWFVELGEKKREIAEHTERCHYVDNWGVLQYWFGSPPKSVPLPGGDINAPMPPGISPDGVHPNDDAHARLLQNAMDKFYKRWFSSPMSVTLPRARDTYPAAAPCSFPAYRPYVHGIAAQAS